MHIGIGTSNGIGIGYALLLDQQNVDVMVIKITDAEAEKGRYFDARDIFIEKTNKMIADLSDKLGQKSAAILKNQIYLIKDLELNSGIESIIEHDKICAEAAVDQTCRRFIKLFLNMDNENMRQRAIDIEDMRVRIIMILMNINEIDLGNLPDNTVLIAHELVPSITALIDTEHVVGIVAEKGGDTSHASILARALEIPAVLSVKSAKNLIHNGDRVIVDGIYGEVFINPIEKTLEIYERKQKESIERLNKLKEYKDKETLTKDGYKFELSGNIGGPEDIAKVLNAGGEGIGLFRTEFLFMNGFSMPTEEEQFDAYRRAVVMSKGKAVIIRTLDIGGDKEIPYLGLAKEANPFLGYRAIRYCLDRTDVFTAQLRAILRASAYGKVKVMIPLVTSLGEVVDVKRHLHNISIELENEGVDFDRNIELGVMIETPAASLIADILAKEVDFFSIGTNDLTQYTMAVDRGNENVAYLYTPFNPAVLRSIKHIISCAKAEHIPVGMCGEAAGDPNMIPLLIAFGLDEFSVAASSILETRKNIASWSMREAKEIEKAVMNFWTDKEVTNYLSDIISKRG